MKIKVEISDKLFQKAKITAKKMKISPEKLCSKAFKQFIEKHDYDAADITAKLNEFYSQTDVSFESNWE